MKKYRPIKTFFLTHREVTNILYRNLDASYSQSSNSNKYILLTTVNIETLTVEKELSVFFKWSLTDHFCKFYWLSEQNDVIFADWGNNSRFYLLFLHCLLMILS